MGTEGITEAKSIAEVPRQLPKQSRIEYASVVGSVLDAGLDQGGHRKKLHPCPENRPRRRPSDNRNRDAEATGRSCVPAAPVRRVCEIKARRKGRASRDDPPEINSAPVVAIAVNLFCILPPMEMLMTAASLLQHANALYSATVSLRATFPRFLSVGHRRLARSLRAGFLANCM
jgi:hypothetical protein